MKAVVRLKPCGACRRDPAFGTLHNGCSGCEVTEEERDEQPKLSLNPATGVYEERGRRDDGASRRSLSPLAFDEPVAQMREGFVLARDSAAYAAVEAFQCLTGPGLGVLRSFESGMFRWNETTRAIEAELIQAGLVADDKLTPWGRFVLEVGGAS